MIVYGKFLADAPASVEGPAASAVWDFLEAAPIPLGSWTWPPASEIGGYGFTVIYAVDEDQMSPMSDPILWTDFITRHPVGTYLRVQFIPSDSMDFAGIENFWFSANCAIPGPPAAPALVSAVRDGDTGTIVATAEVGATVHAWGNVILAEGPTLIELGSAVADGDGVATITLDFTPLSDTYIAEIVSVPCQAVINASNAFGYSPLCADVAFGLIGPAATVAVESVVPAADWLSAVVTLSGLAADEPVLIGWIGAAGINLRQLTGNGPHTITNLNATLSWSPLIIGLNGAIQTVGLTGYCEPRGTGSSPRAEAVTAPYVEEAG